MLNPCPGDETVPKHIFCSKNWYIIHSDKKKVISCFCLILENFKTLKYPNLYDYFIFFCQKLKKSDHVQGTLEIENLNQNLEN